MERDAILGHGASFFLKERLCDLSDAFKTVACSTCGNFAIQQAMQDNKIVCRNCRHEEAPEGTFGQITVPYAFSLLTNLLGGLNINLKFDFNEKTYTVGDLGSDLLDNEDLDGLEDKPDYLQDQEEDIDQYVASENEDDDAYGYDDEGSGRSVGEIYGYGEDAIDY